MTTKLDQPVVCPIVVGRDAALDTLRRWLDRAREGHGQTALLAGEAGIGKSRLVMEARARAQRLGFLIVEGRCFEPDRALPYAPFVDLLQTHVAGQSAAWLDGDLGHEASALGRLLLGFPPPLPAATPASAAAPEQERRRLVVALIRFVSRLAADQPALVIVEDLHWSDDASLDVVLHLARAVATQPILLLLTYRNDDVQPELAHLLAELDRNRLAAELRLDRLAPADIDTMVRAIFGVPRAIRADFLDVISALTDGNPFFVEEILKSLVASGDIFYAGGAWNRKDLDAIQIPRSVQDAVRRRAARLGEPARRVLALAAVAGRRFDFATLKDLLVVDEEALLASIKELIAAQLVVEESVDRFAFRHALTRQTIYNDLLARERQVLHRRVGEVIERQFSTADTSLADLALHFSEGGEWEKALDYSRRAGEHARAMDSPRAAVQHLTRALRAADALGRPAPADLLRARGLARETIGDFEGARGDHEAALAAARASGDRLREWQALLDLGFLWASRDYGAAGGFFDAALALARETGDPIRLARSLNRVGNWHLNTGSMEEARRRHEEALALLRRAGDREGVAETLDLLAMATGYTGDVAAAAAYYDDVIALFRDLGDRRGLVNSLVMSAMLAFAHPVMINVAAEMTVETGLARAAEAVAIAREIGWRAGEAFALLDSGYCFFAVGNYARALEAMRGCLVIAQEIGHRQWETGAVFSLGAAAVDLGCFEAARRLLEQASALAREIGSSYWGGMITLMLARNRFCLGDFDAAEAIIDRFPAPDAPTRSWFDRDGWMTRAEIALARGKPERALAILDRLTADTAHAATGVIPALWLIRGKALAALRRDEEATVVLRQGEAEARRRQARPLLWQILVALGRAEQDRGRRTEAERAFAEARTVVAEIAATVPEGPVPELGIDDARSRFLTVTAAQIPAPRQPTSLQAAKHAFGGLTAREREVAALVARGLSNRAIADELIVGERTVATHVASILAKLDFSSRAQIAAWATEVGLAGPASQPTARLSPHP